MNWKNLWIVIPILLILIWSYQDGQRTKQAERNSSATVHSMGPLGNYIFFQYRAAQHSDSTSLLKRPLLTSELLPENATLVIASPLRPVSHMEAKLVLQQVEQGAQLYLTITQRNHRQNLSALLAAIEAPGLIDNVQYYHGQVETITMRDDYPLSVGSPGERYSFYSPLNFADDACLKTRLLCMIREIPWGDGKIWIQLGAPVFANALLAMEDNSSLVARLSLSRDQFVFDEYHHYFEEAELKDLMSDIHFMAPLFGLLVLCLLAMSMNDRKRFWPKQVVKKHGVKQWHDLVVGLLSKKLDHPEFQKQALELQLRTLARLYPESHHQWQSAQKRLQNKNENWKRLYEEVQSMHKASVDQRRASFHDGI